MNGSYHVYVSHGTYVWVMSRVHESCHVHISHVTYICVMSRIYESYVRYGWVMSSIETEVVAQRLHTPAETHVISYVTYSMSHVTYEWFMSHMNESCHIWMSHVTYEWVMSQQTETAAKSLLGLMSFIEWSMLAVQWAVRCRVTYALRCVTFEWVTHVSTSHVTLEQK